MSLTSTLTRRRSLHGARALGWLLLLLAAFTSARASAHAIGLSRGEYRVLPDGLEARLVFDLADVVLPAAPDARALTSAAGRAELERRFVHNVRVSSRGGQRCPGRLRGSAVTADGGVALDAAYACAGEPDATNISIDFWKELAPGHRHLATSASTPSPLSATTPAGATPPAGATTPAGATPPPLASAREQLLYAEQPRLELTPAPATTSLSALEWVHLGVTHILGGYDHLLFLLALVLVTPALRPLAATVSLFTLAHSISLALSTFRVFAPPPSLTECAIALSIAYVGLENLTPRAARPRYLIVFAFGLIHGFGFAGALAELGLPPAQTPLALLAFNGGVELGQLGILAIAFPLTLHLRRLEWFVPRGVPALSLATALAGLAWFIQRV